MWNEISFSQSSRTLFLDDDVVERLRRARVTISTFDRENGRGKPTIGPAIKRYRRNTLTSISRKRSEPRSF